MCTRTVVSPHTQSLKHVEEMPGIHCLRMHENLHKRVHTCTCELYSHLRVHVARSSTEAVYMNMYSEWKN